MVPQPEGHNHHTRAIIIGLLWRIAWTIGRFTQRLDDHMKASEEDHKDYETRLRNLERPAQTPRRR